MKQLKEEEDRNGDVYGEDESGSKHGISYTKSTRPPSASVTLSNWDIDDRASHPSKNKRRDIGSKRQGANKKSKHESNVGMDLEAVSSDGAAEELNADELG